MNKDVKAKWLAALRSGDYQQAVGQLRNDEGHCCLGVLCDLASKEGVGDWEQDSRRYYTEDIANVIEEEL